MAVNERSHAAWARRPDVRIGAVVAVAIAAAFGTNLAYPGSNVRIEIWQVSPVTS
jgi:hypothetical protein